MAFIGKDSFCVNAKFEKEKPKVAELKTVKQYRINRNKHDGDDEKYCIWYKCPNCERKEIAEDHNYCPMCGVKIKFINGAK